MPLPPPTRKKTFPSETAADPPLPFPPGSREKIHGSGKGEAETGPGEGQIQAANSGAFFPLTHAVMKSRNPMRRNSLEL